MAVFKVFRETALPGTLQPYSVYFVAPATPVGYVEIYVTDAAGTATRRIHTQADIQALINSSLAAANSLTVVADIAARNALAPNSVRYALVRNATGDATVASGAATYVYDVTNTAWVKVSEAESLDVVQTWAALTGKPTSSVAAIDAAVTASHTHANKTQLDKVGEDGGGNLTYNGVIPSTAWNSVGW